MMNQSLLLELLDRVLKSWWTVVAGVCLGLSFAVAALAYLPKTYEAGTTIFVVPRQVPERLVPGTVTDDMSVRLGALRQALLSRTYMQQLIAEVYGKVEDPERQERLAGSVRSRLAITLIRIDPRRGGGIFRVGYRDSDPVRAAKVVNVLARLYIDQNVQFRTDQARGTSETMLRLVEEAEEQLRAKESEIAQFKRRHLYDTSEHRDANLQQLSASREELEDNRAALAQAHDRLQTLVIQQEQAERLAAAAPDGVVVDDPLQAELARLQRELSSVRSRYHDDHPDVQKARKQLDDFIEANASLLPDDAGAPSSSTSLSPLQLQIESTRREIARLEGESERVRGEIDEYRRRLENTPRVDQELSELTENYESLVETYRDRLDKYEEAKAALRIEEAQQGERFEIVESAAPPSIPIQPVPMFVLGLGLVAGVGAFVGPLVARCLLFPKVLSEAGLQARSDLPLLVSITRLPTDDVRKKRKTRIIKNFVASSLSVMVLVAVMLIYG